MRARFALAGLLACGCGSTRGDWPELESLPASAPVSNAPLRNTLVERANWLLYKRELARAEHLANQALRDDPQNPDAHLIRAMVQWMRGQAEASAATTRAVLERVPDSYPAVYHLARILRAQGRVDEAITHLETWHHAMGPCSPERLCESKLDCEGDVHRCQVASAELLGYQLETEYLLADPIAMLETAAELEPLQGHLDSDFAAQPARLTQFARWLEPHAPLLEVEGDRGVLRAVSIDPQWTSPAGTARAGGFEVLVVHNPMIHGALISEPLVEALELERLGTVEMASNRSSSDLVLVDDLSFGGLELHRVPAFSYASEDPEDHTIFLGRQASQAFGALTLDLEAGELVVEREAPTTAPAGANEVPILQADTGQGSVPLVPLHVGGTNPALWLLFGVPGPPQMTLERQLLRGRVTGKADAEGMLTIDKLRLGDHQLGPLEVEVVDGVFGSFGAQIHTWTSLPFAGGLSYELMSQWRVTHVPERGVVWLEPSEGPRP